MPWGMPGAVLTDMVRGKIPGEMQRSTTREESKYGNGALANTQTAAIDRLVRLPGIIPASVNC